MAVHYYMVLLVHMQETETKKEIIKASLYREIVVWMIWFSVTLELIYWFCEALIYKSVLVLH